MQRRAILLMLPVCAAAAPGQGSATARGRLRQDSKLPPAVTTRAGQVIELEGDEPTVGVLRDARLKNEDFEAVGRYERGKFVVNPIHTQALFVWRGGKRLVITYYCSVCAIRAWRPGKCQCCQDEMELDFRDPALKAMDLSR